jgi:anti-anti-sigma factor
MLKVHAKNSETVSVLCLQGQIINGETEILRNAMRSISGKSAVVLDLARVTTVDAHGVGVLLELRQESLANGTRFKLMNLSSPVSKVLEITRLDSVFEITSKAEMCRTFPSHSRVPVAA